MTSLLNLSLLHCLFTRARARRAHTHTHAYSAYEDSIVMTLGDTCGMDLTFKATLLCILGKHSTTKLYPHLQAFFFFHFMMETAMCQKMF